MPGDNRITQIFKDAKVNGKNQPENTFLYDMHMFGSIKYTGLEKWEKIARSMADAIVNQEIYIQPYDRIIGRIYHENNKAVEKIVPDFDYNTSPYQKLCDENPGYEELLKYRLCGKTGVGHITWAWDEVLRLGISGLKTRYAAALAKTSDEKSCRFFSGVLIMLESITKWNDKHVKILKNLGMDDMAKLCAKVPEYPAETFHEAVQAFFMQYIIVMRENPFGGNGPGRLDYYLWPYLQRDLKKRICSLNEARELIDELFIRIDERIHTMDKWVETIVVGGSHPNGESAVNPLSHIMIESIIDLNITHPHVYARLPGNAPDEFIKLCAKYVREGSNRAQILSDDTVIKALTFSGVPYKDAVDYTCGGCMEIGLQGMTSDFLFNGWWNVVKLTELCVTGGICLKTGNKINSVNLKGLENCHNFEEFYLDFITEAKRLINIFLKAQDVYSAEAEDSRPSYLVSSMIADCFETGRNMHGGGARYHDYGGTPVGLPNTADYLYAIKKAVFDDKICTAAELIKALKENFSGFEALRKKLISIPKFGQENREADSFMARLFTDIATIYTAYTNRFGGTGKVIIMSFVWAPIAGEMLGATADGNLSGKPLAQGLTPQYSSMTIGLTAAMNSCFSVPFHLFNGGASTMWDLDPVWASEDFIKSIFITFFENGGQIFQGNVINVNALLEAQKNPDEHSNLIVRVGGFSARFVNLDIALQNEIITRIRRGS